MKIDMKSDTFIYSIAAIAIIVGAAMKILHLPYANLIMNVAVAGGLFFQSWHVTQLKKRIKELESKG